MGGSYLCPVRLSAVEPKSFIDKTGTEHWQHTKRPFIANSNDIPMSGATRRPNSWHQVGNLIRLPRLSRT
jgi:hypothetical protein